MLRPFLLAFYLMALSFPLFDASSEEETNNTNEIKKDEEKKETETPKNGDEKKENKAPKNGDEKKESPDQKNGDEKKEDKSTDTLGGSAEAEKTLKIGLLAFPSSQQMTPLISFGQNIIDKKQFQASLFVSDFKGNDQYFVSITPNLLYAFTDSFTIYLTGPISIRNRMGDFHSSGPNDVGIQLEYAFYTKAHKTYYDQATIVGTVNIPTGSTRKNPPTGFGSNSFFIGGTYSRNGIKWLYFSSFGGVITCSSHRTKFGNQFLYQFGAGRLITNTKNWLFAWQIEFDGTYSWRNKIHGITDPNSGGNVIFITPSLWISSSESFFIHGGIGFPIHQFLFGHQKKLDYLCNYIPDGLFDP